MTFLKVLNKVECARGCVMTSFGMTVLRGTIQDFPKQVQLADQMGVEKIGLGDSQSHYYAY